jgi:DNA helicase-2/ATP-dependent DNA helicase PcrA
MLRPEAQAQSAVEMLAASLQAGNLSDWFAEPADDEIQVMTLHKAKGLEFDVVFHLDMYEWVLPGKKPGENNDFDHPVYSGWEQDLHLHYVGVTRARKCCVLCSSNRRINSEGLDRQGNPSEFLDLPSLPELRRSITTILPAN